MLDSLSRTWRASWSRSRDSGESPLVSALLPLPPFLSGEGVCLESDVLFICTDRASGELERDSVRLLSWAQQSLVLPWLPPEQLLSFLVSFNFSGGELETGLFSFLVAKPEVALDNDWSCMVAPVLLSLLVSCGHVFSILLCHQVVLHVRVSSCNSSCPSLKCLSTLLSFSSCERSLSVVTTETKLVSSKWGAEVTETGPFLFSILAGFEEVCVGGLLSPGLESKE